MSVAYSEPFGMRDAVAMVEHTDAIHLPPPSKRKRDEGQKTLTEYREYEQNAYVNALEQVYRERMRSMIPKTRELVAAEERRRDKERALLLRDLKRHWQLEDTRGAREWVRFTK